MNETHYSDLAEWLMDVESTTSPAGFHGQVTGLWCRHTVMPEDMALDEVDRAAGAWDLLQDFAQSVKAALEDSDCSFEPILPPDNASLAARGDALADWCSGLLFGIGSAGSLDPKAMSAEVQELLRDMTEICKISIDDDDDGAEEAYVEVVEYLKVAAQTLYVELHPQAG
jgi:uncharacterized protein YgfB (UPF0149 family)